MMHIFNIKAINSPAIIERLLRVTRHRGFTLQSMHVDTTIEQIDMELLVTGKRPATYLLNQLQKLYDVKNISVSSQQTSTDLEGKK